MMQNFFIPTLVNTGADLVLFDTGLSSDGTLAALTAAGVTPDQVDVVVLTHMHGDHIGGLMGANATTPTFTNARYVTGSVEHNNWSTAGNADFFGPNSFGEELVKTVASDFCPRRLLSGAVPFPGEALMIAVTKGAE